MLARDKRFDDAQRMLDEVQALLQGKGAPAADVRGGAVDYAKCRLAWTAAKSKVHGELQKLEQAILAEFADREVFDELSQKVRKFDTVLQGFAEDLGDVLDDALNATDDAARTGYHREAARIIGKFLDRAANDPFIDLLQDNPFVPINVKQTLVSTLELLARRLV